MRKKIKRPRDSNQLARLVIDILLGDRKNDKSDLQSNLEKRKAGTKGGKARADKMSPESRKEIAQRAAQKRWTKNN